MITTEVECNKIRVTIKYIMIFSIMFAITSCGENSFLNVGTIFNTISFETQLKETKLFLRSEGYAQSLSREQRPPPSEGGSVASRSYFYWPKTIREWKAILNNNIEGKNYSFSLWLAAGSPQGYFNASLIINHNGVETELANTTFTVTDSDYYEKFFDTVQGKSEGVIGDEIILRITFTGNTYSGSIIYGSGEYTDSHIVLPGNITVY